MDIKEINKSLNSVQAVIIAADGVISNPKYNLRTELSKQNKEGEILAKVLYYQGVCGLVAKTGAFTLSSGIAGIIAGLGKFATISTVSGPIGWTIGGVVMATSGHVIYKKVQAAKKAKQEKERMKNDIIRKQQAIIKKLKEQNAGNIQEINNLKEALSVMEELFEGMNQAA